MCGAVKWNVVWCRDIVERYALHAVVCRGMTCVGVGCYARVVLRGVVRCVLGCYIVWYMQRCVGVLYAVCMALRVV